MRVHKILSSALSQLYVKLAKRQITSSGKQGGGGGIKNLEVQENIRWDVPMITLVHS